MSRVCLFRQVSRGDSGAGKSCVKEFQETLGRSSIHHKFVSIGAAEPERRGGGVRDELARLSHMTGSQVLGKRLQRSETWIFQLVTEQMPSEILRGWRSSAHTALAPG